MVEEVVEVMCDFSPNEDEGKGMRRVVPVIPCYGDRRKSLLCFC